MGDVIKMVQWMKDRLEKVVYNNDRPWGGGNPPHYDCSAAVIESLRAGGFIAAGSNTGWTGSLHDEILPQIAKKISREECNLGDIFISNWEACEGHTGIFLQNDRIIHCNAYDMTISESIADGRIGEAPFEYYRLNEVRLGPVVYEGYTLSDENIRLIIKAADLYNITPSFMIAQMFVESHWGDPNTSLVGSVDNNWAGISLPFNIPADLQVNMSQGTSRPSNEGGYYAHFGTMHDFFKAYAFLLSERNGYYKVEGKTSIFDYIDGLFRVGGANADYAAVGYDQYYSMLYPAYLGILDENYSLLELINGATGGDYIPPTPSFPTNVYYGLRVLGGGWLGEVTNFNNTDSNGFAGLPYNSHDLLYVKVDKGNLRYRVHTVQSGWLDWVSQENPNDTVNGCAGMPGEAIDGVQLYYTTPSGEALSQAYYRSQTVDRFGWLGTCCDDGTSISGYDGWAGMFGEPLDRLQIGIGQSNPFI